MKDFLFALLSGLTGGLAVLGVTWLTHRIFKDLSDQPFRTPVLFMAVGVTLLIIGLLVYDSDPAVTLSHSLESLF